MCVCVVLLGFLFLCAYEESSCFCLGPPWPFMVLVLFVIVPVQAGGSSALISQAGFLFANCSKYLLSFGPGWVPKGWGRNEPMEVLPDLKMGSWAGQPLGAMPRVNF